MVSLVVPQVHADVVRHQPDGGTHLVGRRMGHHAGSPLPMPPVLAPRPCVCTVAESRGAQGRPGISCTASALDAVVTLSLARVQGATLSWHPSLVGQETVQVPPRWRLRASGRLDGVLPFSNIQHSSYTLRR